MPLQLKGTPEGLLLRPQASSWDEFLQALEHALDDAAGFFRGGRVILELSGEDLTEGDLVALRALLESHDLQLWAVRGGSATTDRLARAHGIRTRLLNEVREPQAAEAEALFVQRTLRSGQSINFPGHVTLLGDLNPGAEITAGGHVIVWGRARGVIHAGALGDESAVICALNLSPSQLRIAGLISRPPEGREGPAEPEVARILNGKIVAEPWTARGEHGR